ncbi:uncharacterized protein PV07_07918 [Cladophialophora immunda]|uniref:DUF6536 domain-containing protein n=1 Tax=Cladophialophora immunda TaxID=569365 RepID=A0A0D2CX93_9EURO|nr:uncharacterized protein PV07_07918 [Cladophialophora immunda]KIW28239.1 hypothetical protein PV07_07918 [Cladophialophora immunda]OQV10810.1 hypothetical protein CLAIMM_14748 [Cladophialophora immunda]
MADPRLSASEISLLSDIAIQLDQITLREDYALSSDATNISTAEAPPQPSPSHQEVEEDEHHLPSTDETPGPSRPPRALRDKWTWARDFVHDRLPTTSAGRQQLKRDITRSNPVVARVDTDPRLGNAASTGLRSKWGLQGWRFGVFLSTMAVVACLVAELVMLACAMSLNKPQGNKHNIGVLYVGDCAKVERINTLLAIPLNIIATVLVATSNYVMQCLSAPSRKDIDGAHAAGSYLNIGIPSVHNLFRPVSWNSLLWVSLVLTTVPIHLLLNSAFFSALQANNYGIVVADSTWGIGDPPSGRVTFWNGTVAGSLAQQFSLFMWLAVGDLEHLSRDDCFARYGVELQSDASNVVVITKQDTGKYSTLPELSPSLSSQSDTFEPIDPFTAFQLPEGVGMFFNPFSGNAEPIFNQTIHHWTSGILPQNNSGGLYIWPLDGVYGVDSLRSVFSSFDYNYWSLIKEMQYDFDNPDILRAGQWNPTSWMCSTADLLAGKACTSGKNSQAPSPWLVTPKNFEVDHCLSQSTEEKCSLQYNFTILLIVIGCDIVKIIAMSAVLFMVSERRLATLGDAIASFLERPDPYTRGYCLLEQNQARRLSKKSLWSRQWQWHSLWSWWSRRRNRNNTKSSFSHRYQHVNAASISAGTRAWAEKLDLDPASAVWTERTRRWGSIPSHNRWAAFALLYVGLLAASLVVLWLGVRDLHRTGINNPFGRGFGSLDPNALFAYPTSFTTTGSNATFTVVQTNKSRTLFADVITVNTPQLLFSTLYFMYNGLLTSMVMAAEWGRFASTPKALRVSEPREGQRSTYWLQLPWKYSLPLLTMSIVLHWIVSRSLFMVRINVFGWDGKEQPERDISACGYSPLAILIVILVLVLSLVVMLLAGMQKLAPGIPVCGTNSLAIAAACHHSDEGDPDVSCKPLRWGVTKLAEKDLPGHCSVTDEDVCKPVSGLKYR